MCCLHKLLLFLFLFQNIYSTISNAFFELSMNINLILSHLLELVKKAHCKCMEKSDQDIIHNFSFASIQNGMGVSKWSNFPFISDLVFNVGLWPGAHGYRGPSQFSAVVWREEREHASSSLSEEQMLSVLRLTDFLPSDQQFHISLPYGATGHGGGGGIRSTFKASLVPFHLRKASLWCGGAEMHYLSRSCCLTVSPREPIVKNVTGRSVRNDEVLMSAVYLDPRGCGGVW